MAWKTYLVNMLTSLAIYGCTAPVEPPREFQIIEFKESNNLECILEPMIGDFNGDGLYDICIPNIPVGGLTCAIDWDRDCMQDLVVWTSTLAEPKIYRGDRRLDHCQPKMNLPRGPNSYIIKTRNEL
jgi:hypothetical protein